MLETLQVWGDLTERWFRGVALRADAFFFKLRFLFSSNPPAKYEKLGEGAVDLSKNPILKGQGNGGPIRHGRGFRSETIAPDETELEIVHNIQPNNVVYSTSEHFAMALHLSLRDLPPGVADTAVRIHVFSDSARPYEPPEPREIPRDVEVPPVPEADGDEDALEGLEAVAVSDDPETIGGNVTGPRFVGTLSRISESGTLKRLFSSASAVSGGSNGDAAGNSETASLDGMSSAASPVESVAVPVEDDPPVLRLTPTTSPTRTQAVPDGPKAPQPQPLPLPTPTTQLEVVEPANNQAPSEQTPTVGALLAPTPTSPTLDSQTFVVRQTPFLGTGEGTLAPTKTSYISDSETNEDAPLRLPISEPSAMEQAVHFEEPREVRTATTQLAAPRARHSRLASIFGSAGLLSMLAANKPAVAEEVESAGLHRSNTAGSAGTTRSDPISRFRTRTSASNCSVTSNPTLATLGTPKPRFSKLITTEKAYRDNAPHFQLNVPFEFTLGDVQMMRFLVVETSDGDLPMNTLTRKHSNPWTGEDKVIGWADVNVSKICFSQMWSFPMHTLNLSLPPDMPGLALSSLATPVQATEIAPPTLITRPSGVVDQLPADARVTLFCRAESLYAFDLLGSSDPYFVLSKAAHDGPVDAKTEWIPVFKSEVVHGSGDPEWAGIVLDMERLCGGSVHRQLRIEVWDWDRYTHHDYIGGCIVSVADIYGTAAVRELVNLRKKAMDPKGYRNSGIFVFESLQVLGLKRTFASFMGSGTQLGLCVAVDFGLANGAKNDPRSLHYRAPGRTIKKRETMNLYERMLLAIGRTLEPYDASGLVVAYGFGARIPDADGRLALSQKFNLNGDPGNPLCAGIKGVLDAYAFARECVDLWGPVRYGEVFEAVGRYYRAC